MSSSPSKRVAEALTDDDAPITPLGKVEVGSNSGTLTLTVPIKTARVIGVEPGDEYFVGHDPRTGDFVYRPAGDFDGF